MGGSCTRSVGDEDNPSDHAANIKAAAAWMAACRCVRSPEPKEFNNMESPGQMTELHMKSYRDQPESSYRDTPVADEHEDFTLDFDMDMDSNSSPTPLPVVSSGMHQEIWALVSAKPPRQSARVTLHIYDVGTSGQVRILNSVLRPLGAGIFHCGVEIFGREWSFSDTETGLGCGVFASRPKCCAGHTHFESLFMGATMTPELEVLDLVYLLAKVWRVENYDILSKNCCHFCNELCQRLGVGVIPKWVMNLAGAGAAIVSANDTTCCRQVAGNCADHLCCGSRGPATKPVVVTIAPFDAQPG